LLENTDAIVQSLHKDLRKPKIETVIGEISSVVDEAQFMIKVLSESVSILKEIFQFNF
jgi:hypothetical protein